MTGQPQAGAREDETGLVITPQHAQVARAMAWLYRREMQRLQFDRRAWGQGRLRLMDELVADIIRRAGDDVNDGEAPDTPLPPLGTTFELTPAGAAQLLVDGALGQPGTGREP